MASDGGVAYTLYINTAVNRAFIPILPLADTVSGPLIPRCVDLPVGASASLLHFYTLTFAPDGAESLCRQRRAWPGEYGQSG